MRIDVYKNPLPALLKNYLVSSDECQNDSKWCEGNIFITLLTIKAMVVNFYSVGGFFVFVFGA